MTYIFHLVEDTKIGGSQFDVWLAHIIYAPFFGTFFAPTVLTRNTAKQKICISPTTIALIIKYAPFLFDYFLYHLSVPYKLK